MSLFRFFLERNLPLSLWLFVPAFLLLAASCSNVDPGNSASVPGPSQPGTVEATPEIMAMLEAKLIRKMQAPKRYDKPKEAQQFFVEKRAPLGQATFDSLLLVQAAAQADLLPQYSIARRRSLPSRSAMPFGRSGERNLGAWSYHGPGNIGGRTRALLIHPETPEVMLAAGVAGGIWKTADGGASWTPLTDLLANLAVNSLAMSPHDPDTIYAGTGEGYFNIDFVRGVGIFKSTDGGANWTHLSATATSDFYYVNKIVVSPNNASTIYAATRTGVLRSTDGGGAWTKVLNTSATPWYHRSGCLDLVVRPDQNPDVLVTAAGNTFDSTTGAIYRSADGGNNWTQAYTETGLGRCSLAVAPSDPNYVYALAASGAEGDYQEGFLAVLRSTDGGAAWTARMRNDDPVKLNTVLLSNPVYAFYSTCFGGTANYWLNQGWYDNVIAVDPLDRDKVWAGGVDLSARTTADRTGASPRPGGKTPRPLFTPTQTSTPSSSILIMMGPLTRRCMWVRMAGCTARTTPAV